MTRGLKCTRREQSFERSLGGEWLFGTRWKAAGDRTCELDGTDPLPIAHHDFLGQTRAVRYATNVPLGIAERAS